ncbi:MAG: prepilin-type N-terminal cleavage/methylation domain-containing protein [Holophagaceae bacterium]|nr:prepilin-type N-terminal cleavage/methylation domain-containing protein [Holophagaceae bacterium]
MANQNSELVAQSIENEEGAVARDWSRELRAQRMGQRGFSLVELMVALVFTLVLMAGLASVFRASISSFYTSGESTSSVRRNRLSIDLLAEDINMAGMYLTDMALLPYTVPNTPPFFIIPNVPVANAGDGDPQTTDELYFYLDEPLPFEGELLEAPAGAEQQTASDMVLSGASVIATPARYMISCLSNDYARMVEHGYFAIFKDFWEAIYIDSVTPIGPNVLITTAPTPNVGVTGSGSSGVASRVFHLERAGGNPGAGVLFVRPAQMIKYKIEMVRLDPDPEKPNGDPCLVRYKNDYPATGLGFDEATAERQIVTENVSGFKVYLSANGGRNWAGEAVSYAGNASGLVGWGMSPTSAGIRSEIDTQLAVVGRPGHRDTRDSDHWFRSIPLLVRVDVTTRTAAKRVEFSAGHDDLQFREVTQSTIFVPRHFGLTMN